MVTIALPRRSSELHRGWSQVHHPAFYRDPTRSLTRKPARIRGRSGSRASSIGDESPILPTPILSVERLERSHSDPNIQVVRGAVDYFLVWYPSSYEAKQRTFPHCAVADLVGSWYHCCEIDAATVNLLFKRQEASLESFLCNRYSSSCDLSGSVIGGICDLSIKSMDLDRGGCIWAASMLVKNAESLNDLHLGSTARIAHDYALKRRPPYDEISTSLANDVKKALAKIGPDELINLSVTSLTLCGFDFGSVVLGEIGLNIDFNNITLLRLESCAGLGQAFDLLVNQVDPSELALSAVEDLFVRLETADQTFSASLERFLTSIPGLRHLQVLIERASAAQNLEQILKAHGESLLTLVWDERRGPRRNLDACTSLLHTKLGNLKVISQYCRGLTVLAIPLYWEAISSSDKYHVTVTESASASTEYSNLTVFRSGGISEECHVWQRSTSATYLQSVAESRCPWTTSSKV